MELFNRWQANSKVPRHLKLEVYYALCDEIGIGYIPKMPKLQYIPDFEGQEGEYLTRKFDARCYYDFDRFEDIGDFGYGDEVYPLNGGYKGDLHKDLRYRYFKDDYNDCIYFMCCTAYKVYNVTKEEKMLFDLYTIYVQYKRFRYNKIFIPYPKRDTNGELYQDLSILEKIKKDKHKRLYDIIKTESGACGVFYYGDESDAYYYDNDDYSEAPYDY